ncbi:MAG: transposase [bacterium]|nr:transposase [bacterium]
MRSKRTSSEEQLRLITECHQSGLTDYEWCQKHNIKVSTFYAWVHRLKQNGEIDIPAVIPTVVRKEPEQPDIVKIKIEDERRISATPKAALTPEPPAETLPLMQSQPGYPVMEVIISNVHLRVTNDVNPALLAETIRLLRSAEC